MESLWFFYAVTSSHFLTCLLPAARSIQQTFGEQHFLEAWGATTWKLRNIVITIVCQFTLWTKSLLSSCANNVCVQCVFIRSIENIDWTLFWAINIPFDQSESGLNLMALIGRRWSVWIISRSSLSSDVLSGSGLNVYTAFNTAFNYSDILCELAHLPMSPTPRLFLCCENKMRKGRFLNCIKALLCAHREERTRSVKHWHGPGKPWGWGRDTCGSFISL